MVGVVMVVASMVVVMVMTLGVRMVLLSVC